MSLKHTRTNCYLSALWNCVNDSQQTLILDIDDYISLCSIKPTILSILILLTGSDIKAYIV